MLQPPGLGALACLLFVHCGYLKLRLLTRCSLTACRDAEKAEKLKKDNEKSEEKLPADANA